MTDPAPRLAWVEHALPGKTAAERLACARRHDLGLEVAHRPELERGILRDARAEVVTVQAFGMHEAHPLHPDPARHAAAARHVGEAIELAVELGAARVLAVCGFGAETCARPQESCRSFFAALAPLARERGVRILIELLSPLRAGAMTEPEELERLLDDLEAPEVFAAALDTGHLLDAGRDPLVVLQGFARPVEELQLRGAGSRPPPLDAPFQRWLAALERPPAVVCVEHHGTVAARELQALVAALR